MRAIGGGLKKNSTLIVGIAGASGSGKTRLAKALQELLGDGLLLLHHDDYYRHHPERTAAERQRVNYDHPDALESELLVAHLKTLRAGGAVELPRYNFSEHLRFEEGRLCEPRKVIVVEGILTFVYPPLRDMFDLKIYVDADEDICFIRRLRRDMSKRGRTFESVVEQYLTTVKPMFRTFVLPSKCHADLVVSQECDKDVAIHTIAAAMAWNQLP